MTVVRDMAHRRLLMASLANAETQITATSDRIRREGAGHVFEGLCRETLARGVRISIRWGRENLGDSLDQDAKESVRRAGELKRNLAGLEINDEPCGVHGKVLIVDGCFSLISSFNFLSFGGVAGRERILSGELGLAVFSDEVSKTLAQSLKDHGGSFRE